MHASRTGHPTAVHRILKYLKESPRQGILNKAHGHTRIEGYIDADWVGSLTNRKSTKDIAHL